MRPRVRMPVPAPRSTTGRGAGPPTAHSSGRGVDRAGGIGRSARRPRPNESAVVASFGIHRAARPTRTPIRDRTAMLTATIPNECQWVGAIRRDATRVAGGAGSQPITARVPVRGSDRKRLLRSERDAPNIQLAIGGVRYALAVRAGAARRWPATLCRANRETRAPDVSRLTAPFRKSKTRPSDFAVLLTDRAANELLCSCLREGPRERTAARGQADHSQAGR